MKSLQSVLSAEVRAQQAGNHDKMQLKGVTAEQTRFGSAGKRYTFVIWCFSRLCSSRGAPGRLFLLLSSAYFSKHSHTDKETEYSAKLSQSTRLEQNLMLFDYFLHSLTVFPQLHHVSSTRLPQRRPRNTPFLTSPKHAHTPVFLKHRLI